MCEKHAREKDCNYTAGFSMEVEYTLKKLIENYKNATKEREKKEVLMKEEKERENFAKEELKKIFPKLKNFTEFVEVCENFPAKSNFRKNALKKMFEMTKNLGEFEQKDRALKIDQFDKIFYYATRESKIGADTEKERRRLWRRCMPTEFAKKLAMYRK